jgi:hypothetical protein
MNGNDELAGLRVGLSGAVPSREASGDPAAWNVHDIMVTVTRVTQRVIAGGGVLLHGAHPTFVPLIEASARSTPHPPDAPARQVELFVVVPFLTDEQYDEFFEQRRHDDYATVHAFGTRDSDRLLELERMRDALIERSDVLVCVGGELHRSGARRPGVLVEVEKARARNVPVLLAGAAGGATRELLANDVTFGRGLYSERRKRSLSPRTDSIRVVPEEGPAAATNRIMHEIARLHSGRHR